MWPRMLTLQTGALLSLCAFPALCQEAPAPTPADTTVDTTIKTTPPPPQNPLPTPSVDGSPGGAGGNLTVTTIEPNTIANLIITSEMTAKARKIMVLRRLLDLKMTAADIGMALPLLKQIQETEKELPKGPNEALDEELSALMAAKPGDSIPPSSGDALRDAQMLYNQKQDKKWETLAAAIGKEKAQGLRTLVTGPAWWLGYHSSTLGAPGGAYMPRQGGNVYALQVADPRTSPWQVRLIAPAGGSSFYASPTKKKASGSEAKKPALPPHKSAGKSSAPQTSARSDAKQKTVVPPAAAPPYNAFALQYRSQALLPRNGYTTLNRYQIDNALHITLSELITIMEQHEAAMSPDAKSQPNAPAGQ